MSVSTPCQYAYVYIILTPHEYYTELPALAINGVSNKPGLAHQLCTLHLLSNSYIYSSVQYIYTAALFYQTVLSLRKVLFYILG